MNTPKNLLIANPDQSIVLTPAEVIRRMFAYTDENGILIVPQWPCDDCVEQGYYICRMNWTKADAEEAVAVYESLYAKLENAGEKPCDAQTMLPYPDSGMEEIAYHLNIRAKRLQKLLTLRAPHIVANNEACLLAQAMVLYGYCKDFRCVKELA